MVKKIFIVMIPLCLFLLFGLTKVESMANKRENIKIVALGDSITYGVGDPRKIGFIGRIKETFGRNSDIEVEIKNYGVPKYRSAQLLKWINANEELRDDIATANYITLFIGTNDFRKSANYKFSKMNEKKSVNGNMKYAKELDQIIYRIRSCNKNAPIIVLGLYNPYTNFPNKDALTHFIDGWNQQILGVVSTYNNVKYVPTIDIFTNDKYLADHLHPNAKGYQLIANRIYKEIINIEKEMK